MKVTDEYAAWFTALIKEDLGSATLVAQVFCAYDDSPVCRHHHRLKQDPRWRVDQLPDGTFRWTTPTGRQHTTKPTRCPI